LNAAGCHIIVTMDYEVFLISRMREQWLRRKDASLAVADGIALTGHDDEVWCKGGCADARRGGECSCRLATPAQATAEAAGFCARTIADAACAWTR
jgi:hypothetical protein